MVLDLMLALAHTDIKQDNWCTSVFDFVHLNVSQLSVCGRVGGLNGDVCLSVLNSNCVHCTQH